MSLALCIEATTAVFSVIYAAQIDPYPFVGADRIVRLTMQSKAGQADWINPNGPQIQEVRKLDIPPDGTVALVIEIDTNRSWVWNSADSLLFNPVFRPTLEQPAVDD